MAAIEVSAVCISSLLYMFSLEPTQITANEEKNKAKADKELQKLTTDTKGFVGRDTRERWQELGCAFLPQPAVAGSPGQAPPCPGYPSEENQPPRGLVKTRRHQPRELSAPNTLPPGAFAGQDEGAGVRFQSEPVVLSLDQNCRMRAIPPNYLTYHVTSMEEALLPLVATSIKIVLFLTLLSMQQVRLISTSVEAKPLLYSTYIRHATSMDDWCLCYLKLSVASMEITKYDKLPLERPAKLRDLHQ